MGTGIELLVCGNSVLRKQDQNPALAEDYKSKYDLD
jgi:carbamoyltransferase